jgi:hypothetical protein
MFSISLYVIFILLLVFWIESSRLSLNSLNLGKNPALELEDWLKRFTWGQKGELKTLPQLPQYKFYSEVVEVLLSIARKFGGSYQEPILFLREGLQSDRQFEKKLKEMILGTWLQMGLMMALTWAFIFGALTLVDVKVPLMKLGMILFWQSAGLLALPLILKHQRLKFFGDIGKLWKILYILKSLSRVPLSRSEVFTFAGVQHLQLIAQKNLLSLTEKLQDLCREALKQGGHYDEGVKSLMEELRFQEKWHFELFEKRLTVIKLALISIFFLPSYLAFIFLLLGDLMKIL